MKRNRTKKNGHTPSHEHSNNPLDFLHPRFKLLGIRACQLTNLNDIPGETRIPPSFFRLIQPFRQPFRACQQGRDEIGIAVRFVRCGRCLFYQGFGCGGGGVDGAGGLGCLALDVGRVGGIVVGGPALELEGDLGLGCLPRFEDEADVELEYTFCVAVFLSVGEDTDKGAKDGLGLECECGGPPEEVEDLVGKGTGAGEEGVQPDGELGKEDDGVVDGTGAWKSGALFKQGLAVLECERYFLFPLLSR